MQDYKNDVTPFETIRDSQPEQLHGVTFEEVASTVAESYDVPLERFFEEDPENPELKDAQDIALTLAFSLTSLSHEEMAWRTGRTPNAVDNAIKQVQKRASEEPDLQQHLNELSRATAGEPLNTTVASLSNLVLRHLGLSPQEAREDDSPQAIEARQVMAYLLSRKTGFRGPAIAHRTGINGTRMVFYSIRQVTKKREKDANFNRRLEQLEEGVLPEVLKEADILKTVAAYYDIEQSELVGKKSENQYSQYAEPRAMARHLLAKELGYSYARLSQIFGTHKNADRDQVVKLDKRLETDLELQKQRAEILDFIKNEINPAVYRLMKKVCAFYGVTIEEIQGQNLSDRFVIPREVITYLLKDRFGFSEQVVAKHLQRSKRAVSTAHHNLKNRISENPLLASHVDYIEKADHITLSINERILLRTSEATGLDREIILNSRETEAIQARRIAMMLMAESGHLSDAEITAFFGLSNARVVNQAKKLISRQLLQNAQKKLLVQQLSYIRSGILSEHPSAFKFIAKKPQKLVNSKEVSVHNSWPEIDKSLVSEAIRTHIYLTIEKVAAFYGDEASFEEIIGRVDNFAVNRARRAAVLLCLEIAPLKEVAVCLDSREDSTLASLKDRAFEYLENDAIFAEELESIRKGETRRDILNETLREVLNYYYIQKSEMRTGVDYRSARAQAAFLMIMKKYSWTTYERLGEVVNRSSSAVATTINYTDKRLDHDARLRAEINYLLNPLETPRPPDIEDILQSVADTSGIALNKLIKSVSLEEKQAKRRLAYILVKELGLPQQKIAESLQTNKRNIRSYVELTKQELARQPKKSLIIDCLRPGHSTSFSSKAGEILSYSFKHYGLTLVNLESEEPHPKLERVQNMTMVLLQKSGYVPDDQEITGLAEILGMSETEVRSRIQPTRTN